MHDIPSDPTTVQASALAAREFAFRASLLRSSVGIAIFSSLVFLLWRRFKTYYVRRILDMRPVVASDVEV